MAVKYKTYRKIAPRESILRILNNKEHSKISPEALNELVFEFQQTNDTKLKHKIYNAVSPLIATIASHYTFKLDLDGDAVSEVYLMFENALKSYKHNSGSSFTTILITMCQGISIKLNEINSGTTAVQKGFSEEEALKLSNQKYIKVKPSTVQKAINFKMTPITDILAESNEEKLTFFETYSPIQKNYTDKVKFLKKYINTVMDSHLEYRMTKKETSREIRELMLMLADGYKIVEIAEIQGYSGQLLNTRINKFYRICKTFNEKYPLLSKKIALGEEIFFQKYDKMHMKRKKK